MKIIKQIFNGYPGILIMPDDYLIGEAMPLIVFDAGVGQQSQIGDDHMGNLDALYANGSPLALARDGKLNNIIDPITGKSYRFAVIGLQGNGWCPAPSVIATVVKDLIASYKIDQLCILKTGLSAGGENTLEAIGGGDGSLYVAGVEMSTPYINTTFVNWKLLRAKLWAFHGDIDGAPHDLPASQQPVNAINAIKPGYAHLTIYKGGHGPWDQFYIPTYTETFGGIKMNIYQFALVCRSKPDFLFNTITPPITNTTMTLSASINIVKGIATLDNTASTGNITAFRWDVNYPNNIRPTWDNGQQDGGKVAVKISSGYLPNFTYVFDLSAWDVAGNKAVAKFTVTTDANGNGSAGVIIPLPTKKLLNTITIKNYDSGAPEITVV